VKGVKQLGPTVLGLHKMKNVESFFFLGKFPNIFGLLRVERAIHTLSTSSAGFSNININFCRLLCLCRGHKINRRSTESIGALKIVES
jgi:hypothetical protein